MTSATRLIPATAIAVALGAGAGLAQESGSTEDTGATGVNAGIASVGEDGTVEVGGGKDSAGGGSDTGQTAKARDREDTAETAEDAMQSGDGAETAEAREDGMSGEDSATAEGSGEDSIVEDVQDAASEAYETAKDAVTDMLGDEGETSTQ